MNDLSSKHASENGEIPAMPPGVTVTTLSNGLAIIVLEDHSAPVVSAQAWCATGSIDEGKWLGAGLSHLLEHMLFKGTATRGPGRIDEEVRAAGGYMNAYTSFDRTVYHIDAPSTGARTAIDILCDIMQHASLPEDELAKEKQVILREMDMNQDDPGRRASRRLFETAYTRSPYRLTVIGYPDIFNELTPADVVAYYRNRYAPNNVFYVVAGDVSAMEVVPQIRNAYAGNKLRPIPSVPLIAEPKQTAPREAIEEAPIELGHLNIAWHAPDVRHPDIPALDVLALVLGSGRSSRLYQEIREKKALAHSIDAWTYNPGNPGLLGVSALVDPENYTTARKAILAEVEKLKETPVTPGELAKAVRQFVAGTMALHKTMAGQAQDLGASWLTANDLNFSKRHLAAIKLVTPDDLLRAARQHLTPGNRTLFALLPTGTSPKPAEAAATTGQHPVQKFELPNGLRLLVKEDHRLPFVEFRAAFKGGVLAETPESNGLSLLTAKMLLKGTASRSAADIASQIESIGGGIDSFGGNNSFGLTAEVLSEDFQTGLDIVSDVLLHPSFPAEALEREKEVQLANIKSQRDHLLRSADIAMKAALFGQAGYGLDILGVEASVGRLKSEDLGEFHASFAVPNNCVLAIYGDVDAGMVRQAVERAFGSWTRGPGFQAKLPETPALKEIRRVVETRDKKQAVIKIGFPGVNVQNPDRYALEILQEACSDLGSRLFTRIRENLGLAYFVGAQNTPGLAPGFFAFYAGTAPEKVELVEKELLAEAELLRAEGLSVEELQRTKAKILGHKKIARQELGGLAMTNTLDELYGLGFANIDSEDAHFEAVTQEEIKNAARKYLTPGALVISVVKPSDPP